VTPTRRSLLRNGAVGAAAGVGGCADRSRTARNTPVSGDQPREEGTAATEQFDPADGRAALQALLDDHGTDPVHVVLGAGTVVTDTNVTLPSNTWLSGQGDATVLRFAPGANLSRAGLLRVDEAANVICSDLRVDGNRANVDDDGDEYGFFTRSATDIVCRNVTIHDCPGYGFDPHGTDEHGPSRRVDLVECEAYGNGLDGITFAGVHDGMAVRCSSHDNDRHGFNCTDPDCTGIVLRDGESTANGETGAVVQNAADGVLLFSNRITGNGADGVKLSDTDDRSDHCAVVGTRSRRTVATGCRSCTPGTRRSRGTRCATTRPTGGTRRLRFDRRPSAGPNGA
jgi:hypothetical protein